ncbi:MAG TPA: hypothetical protein PLL09_10070 [Flavobacterium sp.]|uniref:hypothetical protein n=1 Tax=unclassified Flavobacterium TaxID=196869 RepID=UPI0025BC6ACD|nr:MULTISPECIES: hypothetical protein [unclassified Flavobacterium]HRE78156.1 hypothetical protein [Flavobacterium sp.]
MSAELVMFKKFWLVGKKVDSIFLKIAKDTYLKTIYYFDQPIRKICIFVRTPFLRYIIT